MEWGPRGLGNRSIIANPSDHTVIRKINHAIKMRDFWMPFGPSILESRMQDYVVNPTNAPLHDPKHLTPLKKEMKWLQQSIHMI